MPGLGDLTFSSQEFAASAQMSAIASTIQRHHGHCERVFGGILIIYLPEEAKYDPTDDILK